MLKSSLIFVILSSALLSFTRGQVDPPSWNTASVSVFGGVYESWDSQIDLNEPPESYQSFVMGRANGPAISPDGQVVWIAEMAGYRSSQTVEVSGEDGEKTPITSFFWQNCGRVVREYSVSSGLLTVVSGGKNCEGNWTWTHKGIDGPPETAQIEQNMGEMVLTEDAKTLVFVSEDSWRLRTVSLDPTNKGTVSTIAGDWDRVNSEDGVGTNAGFYNPRSLALDPLDANDVVYVGETWTVCCESKLRIRKVVLSSRTVTTLASIPSSTLSQIGALTISSDGLIMYVASFTSVHSYQLRKVRSDAPLSHDNTTLIAGSYDMQTLLDGTGGDARFRFIRDMQLVDNDKTMLIMDENNNAIRVLYLESGIVTTGFMNDWQDQQNDRYEISSPSWIAAGAGMLLFLSSNSAIFRIEEGCPSGFFANNGVCSQCSANLECAANFYREGCIGSSDFTCVACTGAPANAKYLIGLVEDRFDYSRDPSVCPWECGLGWQGVLFLGDEDRNQECMLEPARVGGWYVEGSFDLGLLPSTGWREMELAAIYGILLQMMSDPSYSVPEDLWAIVANSSFILPPEWAENRGQAVTAVYANNPRQFQARPIEFDICNAVSGCRPVALFKGSRVFDTKLVDGSEWTRITTPTWFQFRVGSTTANKTEADRLVSLMTRPGFLNLVDITLFGSGGGSSPSRGEDGQDIVQVPDFPELRWRSLPVAVDERATCFHTVKTESDCTLYCTNDCLRYYESWTNPHWFSQNGSGPTVSPRPPPEACVASCEQSCSNACRTTTTKPQVVTTTELVEEPLSPTPEPVIDRDVEGGVLKEVVAEAAAEVTTVVVATAVSVGVTNAVVVATTTATASSITGTTAASSASSGGAMNLITQAQFIAIAGRVGGEGTIPENAALLSKKLEWVNFHGVISLYPSDKGEESAGGSSGRRAKRDTVTEELLKEDDACSRTKYTTPELGGTLIACILGVCIVEFGRFFLSTVISMIRKDSTPVGALMWPRWDMTMIEAEYQGIAEVIGISLGSSCVGYVIGGVATLLLVAVYLVVVSQVVHMGVRKRQKVRFEYAKSIGCAGGCKKLWTSQPEDDVKGCKRCCMTCKTKVDTMDELRTRGEWVDHSNDDVEDPKGALPEAMTMESVESSPLERKKSWIGNFLGDTFPLRFGGVYDSFTEITWWFGLWEHFRKLIIGLILGTIKDAKVNASLMVVVFLLDSMIITFARPHVDLWKNITEIYVSMTRLANLATILALTLDVVEKPVMSNIFFFTSILGLVPLVINSFVDSLGGAIKAIAGLFAISNSVVDVSVVQTVKAAKSGTVTAFYDKGMSGGEATQEEQEVAAEQKADTVEEIAMGPEKSLKAQDFVDIEDAKELKESNRKAGEVTDLKLNEAVGGQAQPQDEQPGGAAQPKEDKNELDDLMAEFNSNPGSPNPAAKGRRESTVSAIIASMEADGAAQEADGAPQAVGAAPQEGEMATDPKTEG